MCKNILKFTAIVLLLICIVAVPVFGVSFYDSPSFFSEEPILASRAFGGGTAVYLTFSDENKALINSENLNKTADILSNRFRAMGYVDTEITVSDHDIRLDLSVKEYIDSIVAQIATKGEWQFTNATMSDTICDGSMVQDAYVSTNANGGYGVTLEFTPEGQTKFAEKTSSASVSSSYIYLLLDGAYYASAQVSAGSVGEKFSFGQFGDYADAAKCATIIKNGQLPSDVVIEKTENIPATLSGAKQILLFSALALGFLICCVVLILKGKLSGLFPILSLIANIAVFLTAFANSSILLNLATLITMAVCIVLSTLFSAYAVSVIGSSVKEKGKISSQDMQKLGKINVKALLAHAILLAISILGLMVSRGNITYIFKTLMLFACANAIFHFVFVYFPIHSLKEVQTLQKH